MFVREREREQGGLWIQWMQLDGSERVGGSWQQQMEELGSQRKNIVWLEKVQDFKEF